MYLFEQCTSLGKSLTNVCKYLNAQPVHRVSMRRSITNFSVDTRERETIKGTNIFTWGQVVMLNRSHHQFWIENHLHIVGRKVEKEKESFFIDEIFVALRIRCSDHKRCQWSPRALRVSRFLAYQRSRLRPRMILIDRGDRVPREICRSGVREIL